MVVSTAAWAQRDNETLGDAFAQPLRDLSLLRREPAEPLQRAALAPYGHAATLPNGALDCASVASEIEALDAVLGYDLDDRPQALSLMGQARAGAGNAIVDAVEDLVELPYRGLIRHLSGAERRDREMDQAVQAGMVRRAFLRGMGMRECATPQVLAVVEAKPVTAVLEPPISDLELALRQYAAANAAAVEASMAPAQPTEASASVVLVSAQWSEALAAAEASSAPSFDLELARRQLAEANAAAFAFVSPQPDNSEPAPDIVLLSHANDEPSFDLELARSQLAAAQAVAQTSTEGHPGLH